MKPTQDPPIKVKFKKWNCIAQFSRYASNGRIAISLVDEETWEDVATASVNLADEFIEANEIAIKDYSENDGMYKALVEAKIVEFPPLRYAQTSHVTIPICKLLIIC